jgi:CheY-like chemotaxis protein/MinD-like ATPase involved in chromosome partitioning or flagellar assembly
MATILVIDDDLDLQQMLRLMLQRGGHKVITTGDGPDGLAKAKAAKPDMSIVDVMMPGMNGYQVVRKMREDPDLARMAILILTARAQLVDREAALSAQADDYMPKPFAPNELLSKVTELLINRSAAQGPAKRTVTLLSLRGGVGVTSIAVNLALASQAKGLATCLVDLKPGPGHVALQLRLNVKSTWIDWCNSGESTAESVLKTLLPHESGLAVLAAPIVPMNFPAPERVTTLLGVLHEEFVRVVIDAPSLWTGITAASVFASDVVWLIIAPEVGSLQSTVGVLRAMKAAKVPDEHIELIANQIMPRPGLALPAIEKALGRGFLGKLPFDEGQSSAIGAGTPLMMGQPDSALAAAIKVLT